MASSPSSFIVRSARYLILYAAGKLPGLFGLPAGAGDLAVGLLAPIVALRAFRDQQTHAGRVWLLNLLDIAELIVIIGTGFVTSPWVVQPLTFDPLTSRSRCFRWP